MKKVSPLTQQEIEALNRLVKEDLNARVRRRAEAILLSGRGYSIKDIASIKAVEYLTVSRWIDQWNERQIDGLLEGEGRGRKATLTEAEQKRLMDWLNRLDTPLRGPGLVIEKMKEWFWKTLHEATAKRYMKQAGLVWKRVRTSLRERQDEEEFELCKQELEEHMQASGREEIKLLYLDESGFNGTAYIPYAWQPKGRTYRITPPQGQRINVLGILSLSEGTLHVHIPPKR